MGLVDGEIRIGLLGWILDSKVQSVEEQKIRS